MASDVPSSPTDDEPASLGRLTARAPDVEARDYSRSDWIETGDWETEFYAPTSCRDAAAVPLLVLFHGAGGLPQRTLPMIAPLADELGFLVFAPKSLGMTWDIIEGGFGPDVKFIDESLKLIFAEHPVDPARVGVSGFSDGASYALSIGLSNGDLFSDAIAFSPGFSMNLGAVGRPRIFISHGERDRVLPIDMCARPTARQLAGAGYDVLYKEFPGGHTAPPELVEIAVRRFVSGGADA
ncbi:MAG: hypothetical protein Q8M88_04105 [Phenylobacterium sp.]|uniref:alpha/beta hydrolase n=1 Tax=Phenylobacterium sp. TaxID=1871053 RepID=UPI00273539FD|nr:hypothetical protein [Phenylobacterium sp.]MDP3173598.1 hypothetical protein [Phenylobacterium sp.]